MVVKRWRLVMGAAVLAISTLAQAASSIPFTRFTLPNGLTVLVHQDPKAPIVSVNMWYHVGSKDEKPGKTGFAHLFEHLMFNGSENYNDEYFGPLEKAGATAMNGTTFLDRTNYYQNVPTTAVDLALWMESDRMGHLLGAIDQKKLDEQRGVVQNEKRQGENQPYGKVWEHILKASFPEGHPYSWTTIGSMEDLNAATLADVKEWFKTYYGPSNAVLVLAGDITPEQAKQKVEKYFGDIPAGQPLTHRKEWIAKRNETTQEVMYDRVPQARIYRVWNTPQFGTESADRLDLAASILGGGRNSRLYKALVYDQQLASDVSVEQEQFELASLMVLEVSIKPGVSVEKVNQVVDQVLQKFLKQGPTQAELDRVKTGARASFLRSLERVGGDGGKSAMLAQYQLYTGDAANIDRSMKYLESATPQSVKALADKWMSKGDYQLTVLPFPDYQVAKTGADRSHLPVVNQTPDLVFPAVQHFKLNNGIKVVLAQRSAAPTVKVMLQFDAGTAADNQSKQGLANFTMSMLTQGSQKWPGLKLVDQAEKLGAVLSAGSSLDTSYVALDALKDQLKPSLALLGDVVMHPLFEPSDIERVRGQILTNIAQEKAQPVGMAMRVLPPLLYGKDHPYAQPFSGSGNEASVKAIQKADLQTFQKEWLSPENVTIIVTGDTTEQAIKPELNAVFGQWQDASSFVPKKVLPNVAIDTEPRVYLINKPGAQQTLLMAGQLISPSYSGDEAAFNVFNDVLGGMFSSRLNMNLREDKHWSYGARSMAPSAKGQRPFLIFAPVQTDKTKESIQEIQKEWQAIRTDKPVLADEIQRSVLNTVRALPGEFETNSAVQGALSANVTFNRPDDYVETIKPRYEALNQKMVEAAGLKELQPRLNTWVIVGDLNKIEAGIRALNLGKIEVINSDGQTVKNPA